MSFQNSSLWKKGLAPLSEDKFAEERERLRSAYTRSRENAKFLTDTIRQSCPTLTLHDIDHLDALWDAADLVAGEDFDLNPMETFCLGAAILIHDAGHSVAALPGGFNELKSTNEWRDAAIDAYRAQGKDDPTDDEVLNPTEHLAKRIQFNALRKIHARVAEGIASLELMLPGSGQKIHLIEDDRIRTHYGKLIGLIAASHHWSVDEVTSRLPKQVGIIAGFPRAWAVDPIKLACLLRCADAVQIDQRRAPDFLFALLDLHGISADHWMAQNRLALPIVDRDHPDSIIFTSTAPFPLSNAQAWWIAHDLVQVADRELTDSYEVLLENGRMPFSIRGVAGARSAQALAKYIQTEGWSPVDATIRVSDAASLARTLGGRELYGNEPRVILRELIQNGIDAVRARQYLEPHNNLFRGRITIRVDKQSSGSRYSIEDNGIGMSQRVLTGSLIDFGKSFWSGDLIDTEFPGLKSSKFRPIGKYGIGFFSVFMAGHDISVISKRFDQGHSQGHILRFGKELSDRPILLNADESFFESGYSTAVQFFLAQKTEEKMLSADVREHARGRHTQDSPERRQMSVEELVGILCLTVNCDVYVSQGNGAEKLVHSRDWHAEPAYNWLRRIYAPVGDGSEFDKFLQEVSERVTNIIEDGKIIGRGALDSAVNEVAPHFAVGGLSSLEHTIIEKRYHWYRQSGQDESSIVDFVGAIECESASARRNRGQIKISEENLKKWIVDQLDSAEKSSLNGIEKTYLSSIAADTIGEWREGLFSFVFRVPGGRVFRSFSMSELREELERGLCVILPLETSDEDEKVLRKSLDPWQAGHDDSFIQVAERSVAFTNALFCAPMYRGRSFLELPDDIYDALNITKKYLGLLATALGIDKTKIDLKEITFKQSYSETRYYALILKLKK